MAGVRITHPTARNARVTVVERDRPYPVPYQCPAPEWGGCGSTHLFKTHHLNVDETGSVIVNHVLFERIKGRLGLLGFVVANVVDKPPTQTVGLGPRREGSGPWGNIPIIRDREGT